MQESRDINDCCEELRIKWPLIQAEFFQKTGNTLFLTCTYRSPEHQKELFKIGRQNLPGERIVTNIDGVTKLGRHNSKPSTAIDVAVKDENGKVMWGDAYYMALGEICRNHGLDWGGSWKSFKDFPHIQTVK